MDDVSLNEELENSQSSGHGEGSTRARQTRTVSDIAFPYVDLDQAATVPEAIHRDLGVKGSADQLSGALQLKGGAFARRIGGARLFGLLERDGGEYRITELGRRIISRDVNVASLARADAFLNVELYAKLYEDFRRNSLPSDRGLENHMKELGVPEKQTDLARQIFKRAAKQGGYFSFGEDRLIRPAFKNADDGGSEPEPSNGATEAPPPSTDGKNDTPKPPVNDLKLHGALIHALQTLPTEGEDWSYDDLDDWLDGFKGVLRLVYKVKRPHNGYHG